MPAFPWKNANNFTSPLRRFAAGVMMAFFLAVPGAQADHVAGHPNAATMASILNIITQFLLDDPLVIPAPADPKGTPFLVDFNGDGRTDLLVQPPTGAGTVYLFLADINGKYTAVAQSWNTTHLGLAWGNDASTLYAGDYNGDGRADLIVESKSAGGRNALLYSNGNGLFDAVYQTWDNPPPNEAAAPGTVNTTANATVATDQITVITLIPFDDLLIPVPAIFNPGGVRFKADLNGDLKLDIFIQALNPGDTNYIFLADANNKYTAISQSWSGAHLGIADWSAQSVSIRVDNGQLVVWTNDPTGTITRITSVASAPGKVTLSVTNVWDNSQPAVGATAGAFAVSPTGAATYTIPLTVPPGVAGMTLSLALHYSSQSGNGLLGMGWSLGGLSTLHRCPRTAEQDPAEGVGGINFDAGDRLCLDGQRLVAVSGAYWAGSTEYRTEVDSFTRVISSPVDANTGVPQSFTAYTKDGKVLEYGVTGDARIEAQGKSQVRLWAINSIRDRKGNAITFSYTESNATGEYYPSTISYPKGRRVEFTYAARPENISGYVAGSKVAITQRITSIKTYVTNNTQVNTLVRDYRFAYEASTTTGRSRLLGVQECGVAECLAATTFGWQVNNISFASLEPLTVGGFFNDSGGYGGLILLETPDRAGCSSASSKVFIPVDGYSRVGRVDTSVQGWFAFEAFSTDIRIANFDGSPDGRDDVIWREKTYATVPSCIVEFDKLVPDGETWKIAYFNKKETRSTGTGTEAYMETETKPLSVRPAYASSAKVSSGWVPVIVGYFNGDSAVDYIGMDSSGNLGVLYAAAGRSFTVPATASLISDYAGGSLAGGDINGDGKTDLLEFKDGKVYYWHGTGGSVTSFTGRQLGGEISYTKAETPVLKDVNGDGRQDIVLFGAATTDPDYVWLSNGTGFGSKVDWTQGYLTTDLLGTITTGLGVTTAVTYETRTEKSLSLYGTLYTGFGQASHVQYNYGGLRLQLQVVKNYTTSNGLGMGTNKADYAYAGALLDPSRGFLGFATVTATDQASQIATATTYLQAFPNIGVVRGLTRKTVATTAVPSKTLYTLANTWGGCKSDVGVWFRCLASSTESKYETANNMAITTFTEIPIVNAVPNYNPYGNPTSITVTTSGAGTYTKATDYTYEHSTTPAPSAATWYKIGQLKSSTTLSTASRLWSDIYDQGPSSIRKVSYSYTTDGLLSAETIEPDKAATNPEQQITAYSYDAFGNRRTATVSGAGLTSARTTTTDFGPDGQFPVRVVNPAGHIETAIFDARFGVPSRVTDANGLVTTRYYDDFGRLVREIRPDATQSSRTYYRCYYGCLANEAYYITTQTAGAPTVTVYYDMLGRDIRRASDGFNGTPTLTKTVYDARGRVTQVTQPHYQGAASDATRYDYDDLNRVTKETAPDGGITSTAYNGIVTDGNATVITDARGFLTTRYTNALGQVSRINDAKGGITRYDYDHFGSLRYIKDADGHETFMNYDVRGRRVLLSDLDKGATCRTLANITCGAWRYEYNAAGELTQQTDDAKAQVTTLAYDTLGRLTARTEAEGASQWVYDTAANGKGRPASVTGPATVGDKKVYTYDTLSRPVRIATTIDGITYSEDTGYDQTSRIGAISYPETSPGVRLKLHYNYTASGYLSNVTNAVTGTVYWQATAQDAAGRTLQEQLGNGLTTSRSYDAVGRLKTLQTGASIQNLSYTYDLAGNLSTRQNTAQSFSESFGYDDLNRLTSVSGPAPKTMAYSLDGNITHKSDVSDAGGYLYGTPVTPTGPAGPHALTSLRKNNTVVASYTYDSNGNMLSGAGRSYTYTSYNLPKTITQGTATTAFTYSAERVRIKQTAPGETTVYINPRWDTGTHYEKTTKPITGGSVTEHQHYLYSSSGPIAVHKVIATTTSTGTTTSSNTRYLHHDHLGSVDAITSDTGTLVERLSYDAWGKRRQPNGLDAATAPVPATTHHGYTGHEHLDGLGLIHMNARVYDPNIGRFTSADPIGFEGGINLYGYASGNPLTRADLTGLADYIYTIGSSVPQIENPARPGINNFLQVDNGLRYPINEGGIPRSGFQGFFDWGTVSKLIGYGANEMLIDTIRGVPTYQPWRWWDSQLRDFIAVKSPEGRDWDFKTKPWLPWNYAYLVNGNVERQDYVGNIIWAEGLERIGLPALMAIGGAQVYTIMRDGRVDDFRDTAAQLDAYDIDICDPNCF